MHLGPFVRRSVPALALLVAVGCAQPTQTDGQQQLARVVDRALALQSVRLQASLDPAGPLLGGAPQASLAAAVDLRRPAAHVTGRASDPSVKPIEIVVKDGVWWIDLGSGPQKSPGGMLSMPAGDDLRSALTGFATDARLEVQTVEVPCAGGSCHRLTALVPPDVLWDHFASLVRMFVPLPDEAPPDAPSAKVVLDATASTFDPVHAEIEATIGGAPVHLAIDASGFDQPLTIEQPPG